VAASIGYCGLDRARVPLSGDEIRSCWEEARLVVRPGDPAAELPVVELESAVVEGSLGL
jgi:hypothetical protein